MQRLLVSILTGGAAALDAFDPSAARAAMWRPGPRAARRNALTIPP